jgi:hypothetical protein
VVVAEQGFSIGYHNRVSLMAFVRAPPLFCLTGKLSPRARHEDGG